MHIYKLTDLYVYVHIYVCILCMHICTYTSVGMNVIVLRNVEAFKYNSLVIIIIIILLLL